MRGAFALTVLLAVAGSNFAVSSVAFAAERAGGRDEVRVLFIGNSFTDFNRLDRMVAGIYEDLHPGKRMTTVFVAPGGYTLAQHAKDASTRGKTLQRQLAASAGWDFVILQEQSQVPTFDPESPHARDSFAASAELANAARKSGAQVVFFMTWGYLEGDPANREFSRDYPAMQDRIAATYPGLAKHCAPERGEPCAIAEVGLAFRKLYDAEVAAGRDPLSRSSLFRALYAADGRHPSVAGTYVAACAIAGELTDVPVTDARYAPTGLGGIPAGTLRAAVER